MYSLKDYILGLKDLLLISTDKVLITDVEGKVVYANDALLRSTGIYRNEKEKLLSQDLYGKIFRRLLKTEQKKINVITGNELFKFKDGQHKLPFISFNIWKRDQVIGRALVISDGNNEREELKNNLFQNSILNVMNFRSDSIWFMTNVQNGKSTYTSDTVRKVLGWEPEHFSIGGWFFFFSIIHPDDINHYFQSHLEWVIMKDKLGLLYDHVEYTNSFRIRDVEGNFVSMEANSNVLERDERGKTKLVFGSFRVAEADRNENLNLPSNSYAIKIIDGRTYVDLDYLKKLREQRENEPSPNIFSSLSARENQILELVVEEHSSNEISKKLSISIHTVNLHRKQIMKKLGAKNVAGLIRIFHSAK
ncbi:MAG: LuxR C-terminal-related transcriptional regulator [Bacteroidota bacterium]